MMVGDTHPSSCFDGYGYGRGLLEGADCAISNIGVGPGGRPMMEKFKASEHALWIKAWWILSSSKDVYLGNSLIFILDTCRSTRNRFMPLVFFKNTPFTLQF